MEISSVLRGDLEEWDGALSEREAYERGDTCIHIADSLCCTAKTNPAL